MTPLYDEIIRADAVVVGSPVYLWYVSGQTKMFLDRWYAWGRHDGSCALPARKKGVLVFSQGDPDPERYRYVFETVAGILSSGMEVMDILVATDGLEAGAVASNKELMRRAWSVGMALVNSINQPQAAAAVG